MEMRLGAWANPLPPPHPLRLLLRLGFHETLEREFFIDNPLVRIHSIIEIIRPLLSLRLTPLRLLLRLGFHSNGLCRCVGCAAPVLCESETFLGQTPRPASPLPGRGLHPPPPAPAVRVSFIRKLYISLLGKGNCNSPLPFRPTPFCLLLRAGFPSWVSSVIDCDSCPVKVTPESPPAHPPTPPPPLEAPAARVSRGANHIQITELTQEGFGCARNQAGAAQPTHLNSPLGVDVKGFLGR